MSRIIARASELDFESPGRRDYAVAIDHDTIWGDHLVPLTVWVGPDAQAGRGLVAFGSTHGNEYEGPVALKGLLGEFSADDAMPILVDCNPSLEHSSLAFVLRCYVNSETRNVSGTDDGIFAVGLGERQVVHQHLGHIVWRKRGRKHARDSFGIRAVA